MKESYECEVATHIGPESCGAAREGGVEALTRERAGRVFSPQDHYPDADAVRRCGRPHRVHRYREVCQSPARSQTPSTYGSTSRGNREIPRPPRAAAVVGRIGKSTQCTPMMNGPVDRLEVPVKSPNKADNRRRRGWRETVWPKEPASSKTRPDPEPGIAPSGRLAWYVKQQVRIRSCGSRFLHHIVNLKRCAWPTRSLKKESRARRRWRNGGTTARPRG